jgi:intracellular multiplication protein IcmL
MPVKDAIATVLNRNAFYRDGYRLLLKVSLIQGAVIIILVFCIATLVLSAKTRNVYFATSTDGRIINLIPLNEEYRSPAEVTTWAAATAQSVMRFGYHDYRDRLQQASNNFTNSGWDSFSKALKDANIIDAVTAHKLVVSLDVNAAPEILSKAMVDGVFTWVVKFPITITFQGNDPISPTNTALLLKIVRVSTLQNPEGISIEQWVTTSATESR